MGFPPSPVSKASTCYVAGCVPLAFTQEDFFVLCENKRHPVECQIKVTEVLSSILTGVSFCSWIFVKPVMLVLLFFCQFLLIYEKLESKQRKIPQSVNTSIKRHEELLSLCCTVTLIERFVRRDLQFVRVMENINSIRSGVRILIQL